MKPRAWLLDNNEKLKDGRCVSCVDDVAEGVGISLGLDTFYFCFDTKGENSNLSLIFNDHYPLNKKAVWQLHQQPLNQQLLAICRASELKQSVNLLKANELIEKLTVDSLLFDT